MYDWYIFMSFLDWLPEIYICSIMKQCLKNTSFLQLELPIFRQILHNFLYSAHTLDMRHLLNLHHFHE